MRRVTARSASSGSGPIQVAVPLHLRHLGNASPRARRFLPECFLAHRLHQYPDEGHGSPVLYGITIPMIRLVPWEREIATQGPLR